MNEASKIALFAYLEALKNEGFTHLHLSSVIPMHAPQPNLERRRQGLPVWTQFPDLDIPKSLGFYDRLSGWVYFDEDLYNRIRNSR